MGRLVKRSTGFCWGSGWAASTEWWPSGWRQSTPPAARGSFHSQPRRADGRDAQLVGGLGGRQRALPEPVEHIAAEGRCVTMDELLMLFKDEQATRDLSVIFVCEA